MGDDDFESDLQRNQLRPEPEDDGKWGWTPGRVFGVAAVLAMFGFWIWAFSPLAPRGHPDELDDPAFATFAEARCAEALDRVAGEVPLASVATSQLERADQIEAATDIFSIMLADLTAGAPEAGTADGDLIQLWLRDWGIYVEDRYAYAADFRAGIDGAFTVTTAGRGQITDPIDSFAGANRMISCAAPQDV